MEMKKNHNVVISVLLIIIAYEWLIASVDKLLTKNYFGSLHQQMARALPDIQLQPYSMLVKSIAIPQYHLFGILVLLGELFVGLTFVFLAIQNLQGKTSKLIGQIGLIASIIAAFMNLNYALLGGDTLFVDPANAFQEAISIDWMLFLFELTMAFYFYSITASQVQVQQNVSRRKEA